MNFWPPYLGAGVSVKLANGDPKDPKILVSMKLHKWNHNYVGTHFGGSLYSMVDPFYMLILMRKVGPDYLVWDKMAEIRFIKPGKGRVYCQFYIPDERVMSVLNEVDSKGKYEPVFEASIFNEEEELVAKVTKTLWVKRKKH